MDQAVNQLSLQVQLARLDGIACFFLKCDLQTAVWLETQLSISDQKRLFTQRQLLRLRGVWGRKVCRLQKRIAFEFAQHFL